MTTILKISEWNREATERDGCFDAGSARPNFTAARAVLLSSWMQISRLSLNKLPVLSIELRPTPKTVVRVLLCSCDDSAPKQAVWGLGCTSASTVQTWGIQPCIITSS